MPKKKETSSERYKKVIRQRRIFVLSLFVIVVMLCVCLFTPLFGVKDISVSGNSVLSSEDIITTSGIQNGENVFRVQKSKAVKNLMTMAYIEGAEIKRKFPARIEIVVDEAEPDIILDTPTQFVVSTIKGRVLEMTDDVTHLTSPIVYGVEVTGAEIASNVRTADEELFRSNLAYIQCFKETEHWENIDEFYVGDITNFMVVLKTGMKVTFGSLNSTEALQRKIKMMTKILEQVEQTERSYLDLTTDKGYYGEYSDSELEEMERKANARDTEEEVADSDAEETSDTDSETEEDAEASSDNDKTDKEKKESKQDSSEKTEKTKESAKPSAETTVKPSEESEPRKKESGEQKSGADEKTDEGGSEDEDSAKQESENDE